MRETRSLERSFSTESGRGPDGARGFSFPAVPGAFREKERMMNETTLRVRTNKSNPNHHLWNNNGTWWCHYTVHFPDFTKQRVRRSLQTADLQAARRRRDVVISRKSVGERHALRPGTQATRTADSFLLDAKLFGPHRRHVLGEDHKAFARTEGLPLAS
jgi:hypothetical protein